MKNVHICAKMLYNQEVHQMNDTVEDALLMNSKLTSKEGDLVKLEKATKSLTKEDVEKVEREAKILAYRASCSSCSYGKAPCKCNVDDIIDHLEGN